MIFRLKKRCGDHYENGVRYRAGAKVESSYDLCSMYPNKFERDFPAEQKAGVVTATKPNIPPPIDKGEDEKTVSSPLSDYGEDVTTEFPTAEQIEVKVFEKSNWFTVIDEVDNSVLNEKKLRRKEVEPFLIQYLEDDAGKD